MVYNTNSELKMPLVPPPQQLQSEALLFSDILKEKTLALRDSLYEFLQVYSYHKFDVEFSNFLKHIKHMVQEGQRAGLNSMSRITNSSHLVPMYSKPSILNSKPPTTFLMFNSTRNSTFRLPENNFQSTESSNPLELLDNINFQPRVVLTRLEQLNHTYRGSSTLNVRVTELKEFLKLSSNNSTKQKENVTNFSSSSEKINKEKWKKLITEGLVKEKIKNLKTTVKKNKQENTTKMKVVEKCSNKRLVVQRTDLFDCLETSDDDRKSYNYNIMESPGKISLVLHSDKSRSKTPPMFNQQVNTTTTKSLIISEPPTPLNKSREAKALKRIKAPKITLKKEIKNKRINKEKKRLDYKAACKTIC